MPITDKNTITLDTVERVGALKVMALRAPNLLDTAEEYIREIASWTTKEPYHILL